MKIKFSTLILACFGALPMLAVFAFIGGWIVSNHRNNAALEKARAICGAGPKFIIYDDVMWRQLIAKSYLKLEDREKFDTSYVPELLIIGDKALSKDERIVVFYYQININGKKIITYENTKVFFKYPIDMHWITPGFAEFNCYLNVKSDFRKTLDGY